MNLDQQLTATKNMVRLLEQAGQLTDVMEPVLTAAMAEVAALIRTLPDGLLRESAWKAMQPQVLGIFERAGLVLGQQVELAMAAITPEQASWALGYLKKGTDADQTLTTAGATGTAPGTSYGFSSDAPGAAAARRASTGVNSAFAARTVEAFAGKTFTLADIKAAGSSPELLGRLQQRVPDDVRELVANTRINGAKLRQWFGDSAAPSGVGRKPAFAKFAADSIDRNVRAGFLAQVSTEEVARNLIFDEVRGKMRLGTGAVRLKSDARTIARTALMDMADRAHYAQWDAMSGRDRDYSFIDNEGNVRFPNRELGIQRWRWDSSTDSRLCAECALLDGQEWKDRSDVPSKPHPGCRCQILPVTATELELRKDGDSLTQRETVTGVEFTNQKPPAQRPGETRAQYRSRMSDEGWFLTKGRGPSGERWNRRRVERQGQDAADWLASLAKAKTNKRSAQLSLQEFFGSSSQAGAQRAAYFTSQIQKGVKPKDALNNMLREVGGNVRQTRWIPVAELRKINPRIEGVAPVLSERQQRELAKRRSEATSREVKRLERQLREAQQQARIDGDTIPVEVLKEDLARARARGSVPLSRIPAPRRGY